MSRGNELRKEHRVEACIRPHVNAISPTLLEHCTHCGGRLRLKPTRPGDTTKEVRTSIQFETAAEVLELNEDGAPTDEIKTVRFGFSSHKRSSLTVCDFCQLNRPCHRRDALELSVQFLQIN